LHNCISCWGKSEMSNDIKTAAVSLVKLCCKQAHGFRQTSCEKHIGTVNLKVGAKYRKGKIFISLFIV